MGNDGHGNRDSCGVGDRNDAEAGGEAKGEDMKDELRNERMLFFHYGDRRCCGFDLLPLYFYDESHAVPKATENTEIDKKKMQHREGKGKEIVLGLRPHLSCPESSGSTSLTSTPSTSPALSQTAGSVENKSYYFRFFLGLLCLHGRD